MEAFTQMFDDLIQSSGRSHEGLMMMGLWVAIIVVIIVLGLAFWRNLFGIIIYPRVTFMRIAGEQQILPCILTVLLFGLINSLVSVSFWRMDAVKQSYIGFLDQSFRDAFVSSGSMTGADVEQMMDTVTRDVNATLGLFAIIPILALVTLFFMALAYFVTAKVIGKGSGGFVNFFCGLSYFFWIFCITNLGSWMWYINELYTFGMILMILGLFVLLLYLIFVLRDYMHCSWSNAVIGVVILGPILYFVFMFAFFMLILFLMSMAAMYL